MRDINLLYDEQRPTPGPTPRPPEREKEKTSIGSVSTVAVAITVLVVIIAVLGCVVPWYMVHSKESRIEELDKKITSDSFVKSVSLKSQLNNVESKINDKLAVINKIDAESISLNQIIFLVKEAAPKDTFFTEFLLSGRTLTVGIQIQDPIQAAEFISNIHRSGYITVGENVKSLTITRDNVVRVSFDVGKTPQGKVGN